MSPELIAILAVGATIAGLVLTGQRSSRQDIADLRKDLAQLRKEVGEELGQLRERIAHLEGLLDGLREAIARNPAA